VEPSFWAARWQEGKTAFHEGAPNAYLTKHLDRLASCKRVLVPMCGKSEDLAFLASRGHEVVGIELVEDAVKQFFSAHDVTPDVSAADGLTRYVTGAITIYAGDLFDATSAHVGAIDGIYDRAALVALPADMRTRYVAHLRTIAPAARAELLVSLEIPPDKGGGPPFSVPEAEVRSLFPGAEIEELGHGPDPQGRGMTERCYALRLR
jgi:thiopurine S-methyltransferase